MIKQITITQPADLIPLKEAEFFLVVSMIISLIGTQKGHLLSAATAKGGEREGLIKNRRVLAKSKSAEAYKCSNHCPSMRNTGLYPNNIV